jgi:hypothetical protein
MITTYVLQHQQTQAEVDHPELSSENQNKTPTSNQPNNLINKKKKYNHILQSNRYNISHQKSF